MISKKMEQMVANSSAIRAMFEEGNKMAEKYGAENVYDFSLGNPNVPAPKAVKEAIVSILESEDPVRLHGYTNSNAVHFVWQYLQPLISLLLNSGILSSCSNTSLLTSHSLCL